MIFKNIREAVRFSGERMAKVNLCETDKLFCDVYGLEPGQGQRVHAHQDADKIYVVLEGTGQIELDGQTTPLKPFTAVMIRPGCRHRAIGKFKILNIAIPKFDPADEWFD